MMKNLIPLENDLALAVARLNANIESSLKENEQRIAAPLQPDVHRRYDNFFAARNALEQLDAHEPLTTEAAHDLKRLLEKVYDKIRPDLVTSIADGQSCDFTRSFCQYCGILTTKTLEHYVPKADFPEFYVLSINLVPSCKDCNVPRRWLTDDGRRRLLNFYFDPIPAVEDCLMAEIKFSAAHRLRVEYKVSSQASEPWFIARYEEHFSTLKLKERYELQAAQKLDDEVAVLTQSTERDIPQAVMRHIYRKKADAGKTSRGVNDWEAVFYRALGESEVFWNWVASRRRGP